MALTVKWNTRVSEAKSFTRAIMETGYDRWLACQSTEVRVAHELMGEAGFQDWLRMEMSRPLDKFRSMWDDPVIRQWPPATLETFKHDALEWANRELAKGGPGGASA